MKRLLLIVVAISLIIYFGAAIAAYLLADKLIFQPQPVTYRDDDSVIKLTAPNGEKISAKFFRNETAELTILFSHGNAEDIAGSSPFFEHLSGAGFNVLAYDYRGYGTSEGAPSEQNSYEDAETAYNYLVKELNVPPEKIIIHGRSLGGAVSIDLASRKKCGGLIAESTFVSAFRVVTGYRIFPFDKFNSLSKIERVACPVLFIHGKKDEVIAYRHSERLFSKANEPKFFHSLDEAGHNDVSMIGGQSYLQRIRIFADALPR